MSVEPGRQLAGRYRVEDLLTERAGARMWRAVDEVLQRSVAVDVLPADSPRASALIQAARRSAVVTDGRFLRVLDAAEENGDVYVVREWAPGEPLELVLADGPLPHRRAAWIVHEVAEAISAAHSAGIYHLRLTPGNVLVTDTGGVKITGLATDAALHGVKHADAEAEDVRALGRLLYASLVARWPGGPECGLPAAPAEHGRILRPGQVRAGVPREIDDVCERILADTTTSKAEPLRQAGAVAAELDATVRLATDAAPLHDPEATQAAGFSALREPPEQTASLRPQPTVAPPRSLYASPTGRSGPGGRNGDPAGDTAATQPVGAGPQATRQIPATTAPIPGTAATATRQAPAPPSSPPAPPAERGGRARGWLWVGVVALVAALAAVAFFLGLNSTGSPQAAPQGGAPTPTADPLQPVGISSVSAFDPYGEEGENDDQAALVLDGDPGTQWTTLSYEGDPKFGGLKPGLGLILDLGRRAQVRQVTIGLDGGSTDLQVRAAPAGAGSAPSEPGGYTTVGRAGSASGRTVVELDRPVSTRFLLLWLTRLPPESDGTFRGAVNEITVQG